jgi:small nuclear ribonucleoprotein (snRNP)-like protein
MTRTLITLFLALGLVLVPTGPAAHGRQQSSEAEAAKVKSEVMKRLSGKKERVKIKLRGGSELKGRITQSGDNSFTVTDERTGNHTDIGYADVLKLQGRGMSTGKKILIASAIGVGVLVTVALIAIRNFDPFKNGVVIR